MKSLKPYESRLKKILHENRPPRRAKKPAEAPDPVVTMIEGILHADATETEASTAMKRIHEEFVDYNELRVAPAKDIVECVRELPFSRRKANTIQDGLNAIFYRTNDVSGAYMEKMPAKAVRRHLMELGLDHFAASYTALVALGVRALPVDQTLIETLQINAHLPADMPRDDIQKLLERVIGRADTMTAHRALRQYVARHAKALARHRKLQAAAEAKAAKAQAAAEAQRARAEASAKAAQAAAEAKLKAKKKSSAPARSAGKPAKKAPTGTPQALAAAKKAPAVTPAPKRRRK